MKPVAFSHSPLENSTDRATFPAHQTAIKLPMLLIIEAELA
jgi:hypothetical protein